jgi:hypothetical protein
VVEAVVCSWLAVLANVFPLSHHSVHDFLIVLVRHECTSDYLLLSLEFLSAS